MRQKQTTFYCFSPPVMLATFLIESGLLIYVVFKYKMTTLTRLAVAMLACLAIFQMAEYYVCGGLGVNAATWSRVGYAAITMLPPLGLHIVQVLTKRKLNRVTLFAYASAFVWIGTFLFSNAASGHVCGGNYVIFQIKAPLNHLYFLYYYVWLFTTMFLAVSRLKRSSKRVRSALSAQVTGYTAFILPTTVVNLLWPESVSGIPSIMCGFAVIFAITLVMGVLPVEQLRVKPARSAARRS